MVYVPPMRTQLVAAARVAEALATRGRPPPTRAALGEIAGPRAETLAEMATLLAARGGNGLRVEEVERPVRP